jgi:hypothetical protein
MTPRVILAPTADLATALNPQPSLSVEAEYGSIVVEGTLFTAAHHQATGPFATSKNPAPCNNTDIPVLEGGTILVSHFDLDTVGGCLRGMNRLVATSFEHQLKPFWTLAEFVDLNGPHKLGLSGATEENLRRLHAFWAWKQQNIPRFPRDAVTDITQHIVAADEALSAIVAGDETLLAAGDEMKAATEQLNLDTFCEIYDDIIIRIGPSFVNHLYDCGDFVASAVVAFNTLSGGITVSLAEPIEGISCRDIVQSIWGPEAGGHDGIAGSPRGQRMLLSAVFDVVETISAERRAALCPTDRMERLKQTVDPFDTVRPRVALVPE